MPENDFAKKLKLGMDQYVHLVYSITRKFPKEELYGATSQLRRAVLSVILNYIEGFARSRNAVKRISGRYLMDHSRNLDTYYISVL